MNENLNPRNNRYDKNVWYMNHYSGSPKEANYGRPFYLSKSLTELGVKCRVIAASFHHQLRYPVEIESKFYSEDVEGVPYTWVNTPKYMGNGLDRLKNMFTYAWMLWKHDLVHELGFEKPDVIIVSSVHPFHYFAGRKWAKKYKAKLIFEVRDIWPLTLTKLLGVHALHPLVLLLAWIERRAYKLSDHVVCLLPNAFLHMKTKGLTKEKFNYIPNGIYIRNDEAKTPSRHESYLKSLKENGKFLIAYTGNHGVPNAMMQFLEAAKILKDASNDRIALIFLGKGVEKEKLISFAEAEKLDNVHFLDPTPQSEVSSFLDHADICLVGGKNIDLYKFGVSYNKVFEYMLAEKAIIFTLDSPNNPVENSGGGICIKSSSPKVLADAMIEASQMTSTQLHDLGMKSKRYLLQEHTYDILAKKYLALL